MTHTVDLAAATAGWAPGPQAVTGAVPVGAVDGFSALLDLAEPAAGEGEPVPPLWHWFGFLGSVRQSELGEDGHPAAGHFLPPLPHRRRMIAGGRLTVREPLRVGVPVPRRTELVSAQVKQGRTGQLLFVTVRHEFGAGRVVEEQDVVYRSQPSGTAGPLRPAPASAPAAASAGVDSPRSETTADGVDSARSETAADDAGPPPAYALVLPTSPTVLFRFSALTANAHRIHYDEPYARSVEGYPGLVVHGPLLALLALELPRRHADRPVAAFDYRLRTPVYAGEAVTARARVDGLRWQLTVGPDRAPTALTATAHLFRDH